MLIVAGGLLLAGWLLAGWGAASNAGPGTAVLAGLCLLGSAFWAGLWVVRAFVVGILRAARSE